MNRVAIGDCRDILPTLAEETFQTCVTSPPYFGLRDYGHDQQIGLEATPDAYVAELVAVFREVRRVLRDDGTVWLNLGDSYAGSWGNQGRGETRGGQRPVNGPMLQNVGAVAHAIDCDMDEDCSCGAVAVGVYPQRTNTGTIPKGSGFKPKDLLGIPWRVAFALQSDGWYLRSDIIWSKPNPMPESVTDRPTKAHEYLFLLSKSERYCYDAAAIAEDVALSTLDRLGQPTLEMQAGSALVPGKANGNMKAVPPRFGGSKFGDSDSPEHRTKSGNEYIETNGRRNRRTVWTIPTTPYSGAHFAVMPEKLVEPCILAGCPEGGIVLDPFFGSGTVGRVAERLGRRWFGCELNPAYKPLIEQRTAQVGMMFDAGGL